jgi:membrane protease YdiL (CAAX protease family)
MNKPILIITWMVLLLTLLLYDSYVAQIFSILFFGALFFLATDKNITLKLEKEYNPNFSSAIAIGGMFIVWIIPLLTEGLYKSITSMSLLGTNTFSLGSVITLFADVIPYFKGSAAFTLLTYGLFTIPFIETTTYGVIMEGIADNILRTKLNKNNLKVWSIVIITSLFFAFLHLTAKQGSDITKSIFIVTIMFLVTGIMIIWRGQTKEAILMHIGLNTTAVLVEKKIIPAIAGVEPYMVAIFISIIVIIIYSYATKLLKDVKSVNLT